MTDLFKQLEDKKKELENHGTDCDCMTTTECNENYRICKSNIAILEQAIAEIEKQRQEIIEEIGYKIFSEDEQKSNNVWYKKGWDDSAKRINKELQQLNQQKTEKENSK